MSSEGLRLMTLDQMSAGVRSAVAVDHGRPRRYGTKRVSPVTRGQNHSQRTTKSLSGGRSVVSVEVV